MSPPTPSIPRPLVATDGWPSHAQYDLRGSTNPMGDGLTYRLVGNNAGDHMKDNGLTLEDLHRDVLRTSRDIEKVKLWIYLLLSIDLMVCVLLLWAFLPTLVDMTIKLISAFKRAPHQVLRDHSNST
ncbi:hypothetical protein TWF102_006963 [Orbilia oligospora]|uniref:Uncharacterized protein n=1 Tax=Orbilia oligospora TaxID=2813651 RepID=A0A7C8JM23_ORBOL|nr:hypothetical protein TWF103_005836 [Orbilia oligospora]KAF3111290.1 hypothetical protein TWF102_006963 [Orbilia oligospora]